MKTGIQSREDLERIKNTFRAFVLCSLAFVLCFSIDLLPSGIEQLLFVAPLVIITPLSFILQQPYGTRAPTEIVWLGSIVMLFASLLPLFKSTIQQSIESFIVLCKGIAAVEPAFLVSAAAILAVVYILSGTDLGRRDNSECQTYGYYQRFLILSTTTFYSILHACEHYSGVSLGVINLVRMALLVSMSYFIRNDMSNTATYLNIYKDESKADANDDFKAARENSILALYFKTFLTSMSCFVSLIYGIQLIGSMTALSSSSILGGSIAALPSLKESLVNSQSDIILRVN